LCHKFYGMSTHVPRVYSPSCIAGAVRLVWLVSVFNSHMQLRLVALMCKHVIRLPGGGHCMFVCPGAVIACSSARGRSLHVRLPGGGHCMFVCPGAVIACSPCVHACILSPDDVSVLPIWLPPETQHAIMLFAFQTQVCTLVCFIIACPCLCV
jgi:hypothetical protein